MKIRPKNTELFQAGERTDGRTNGQADERTGGRTDGRANGRAGERTGGGTDGRANGWTDGRTQTTKLPVCSSPLFCQVS